MRKLFNSSALLMMSLVILLATSCKKDEDMYNVTQGSFTEGALTAEQSNIVLIQETALDTVLTLNCDRAYFGPNPAIIYTVQMDLPADTVGGTWAKAVSFPMDAKTMQFKSIGGVLNEKVKGLGATIGSANKVVFRIMAEVRNDRGDATPLNTIYSNSITLDITPYASILYVPGAYQGWNAATAPKLAGIAVLPGKFEGYVYITGADKTFKYTNAPDLTHIVYGAGNGNSLEINSPTALSVTDNGYYELTADLNTNTWTATKTIWGIIGDATPGGWDADTDMSYDPVTQVWTVTADMKAGSFKFRANHEWKIDFGIDNGKLVYVDNPFLPYNDKPALSIPEAGNYTITLDLHESQNYTFNLKKNGGPVVPPPPSGVEKYYVPGGYQNWDPATAATILQVPGQTNKYEGYVYMAPSTAYFGFKLTPQAGWTPMAYGDLTATSGNIAEANFEGGNMEVAGPGYYELTADFNTLKWTATKTIWSIIGSATPGGWDADTDMSYDPATQVWSVTANMTPGEYKFRANHEWKIDFGLDNGKLVYVDNPFLPYNNKPALLITEAGNYTITLDLHLSQNYTYTVNKN
ncbi:MAG: SusF/SusE family outer membrane protein [Bacteroidota bacterium]